MGHAPHPLGRLSSFSRRDRLAARCVRRGHLQPLDVPSLLRRYGDLDAAALRARLLCVRCGGRHPELLRSFDAIHRALQGCPALPA